MARDRYVCRNPQCGEPLHWRQTGGLCASCHYAYRRGALLAGVVAFVIHLVLRFL